MRKNKPRIIVAAVAAAVIVLVCALCACSRTSELNPDGLKNCIAVDLSDEYQTLEGFGSSSCWW